MIQRLFSLLLVTLPASVLAGPDASARSDVWLETLREGGNIPAVSAAVGKGGEIVWSGTVGMANLEYQLPATAQTRFRLGSVSKLMTVAAAARLVEQGKLDVDRPVAEYLPDFPAKDHPFTARQLAMHTAGIRHYNKADQSLPLKHYFTVGEALEVFSADPLQFEPGTQYAYSSYGYNLLSAVLEAASGKPFLDLLQDEVYAPLGMSNSGPDHVYAIVPNRTGFYFAYQGQLPDADIPVGTMLNAPLVDNSMKWASGGLLGTAEDLVRFSNAHLEPGYLSEDALSLLFTSDDSFDTGREFHIAFGWRVSEDEAGRARYHHGGAIAGGRAFVMIYPESGITVAILANMYTWFGPEEAAALVDFWRD